MLKKKVDFRECTSGFTYILRVGFSIIASRKSSLLKRDMLSKIDVTNLSLCRRKTKGIHIKSSSKLRSRKAEEKVSVEEPKKRRCKRTRNASPQPWIPRRPKNVFVIQEVNRCPQTEIQAVKVHAQYDCPTVGSHVCSKYCRVRNRDLDDEGESLRDGVGGVPWPNQEFPSP